MQRYLAPIVVAALLLTGCSHKTPTPKSDAKINALLIKATFLEGEGYYQEAARLYEKLYTMSGSLEILKRSVADYIRAKEFDKAMALVQEALKKEPKNSSLLQLAASLYLAKGEPQKALEAIKRALEYDKSAKNYEYLASIYLAQKRYDLALKYYKSAYAINPSIHNVNTIAYIMYFYLDKKEEAIAYLETHTRIYGCQKEVCKTLISLYSLQNNIDGLLSVYKRLYQTYKEEEYLRKIVELYLYKKEYSKAIEWAKELDDDEYMLDLYKIARDYKKAYEYAMRLYRQTKDPKYLAQAAIFEYEGASHKDPKLVEDVAKKLELAIKTLDDPVYLNYLGYLYIDHDLNIKRGVELVKKALEYEPDSPYYLDSLAWGYYKLGRCQEALRVIKRVYYELGLKDSEIQLHLTKIRQCAKDRNDAR